MYKRSTIIILVNLVYFKIGLMVSITGALIPDIINTFQLSYSAAAALPLAYYLSFGIFAIPWGIIIEKFPYKKVLLSAYTIGVAGVILFAWLKNYYSSVISLFIIGCSLTAAQVLSLPLLREAVGTKRLAFHTTLNTCLYAVGSVASPYLYTLIIKGIANPSNDFPYNLLHYLHSGSYAWAMVYWVFLLFFIIAMVIIMLIKFPPVRLDQQERIGNFGSFKALLTNKYIWLYFFSLFSYAACEQGNANWISQFLLNYHNVDPQKTGALVLSWHWLLFAVGCMIGMILLKYFDSKKIFLGFTLGAMVSVLLAIYGGSEVALVAFPLVGLFHSIMWPVILSLGMNSVRENHGSLSGLLFAASTGGAFGVMMVGKLGDAFGLRYGFLFLMICYIVVASVYTWSGRAAAKEKSIIAPVSDKL